jgi:hypothetical protein
MNGHYSSEMNAETGTRRVGANRLPHGAAGMMIGPTSTVGLMSAAAIEFLMELRLLVSVEQLAVSCSSRSTRELCIRGRE